MSASATEQHSSHQKWIIGVSLASALAAGIVGFLIYSAVCPCERTPGGFLFGAAADGPVDDWSFANKVPLCQLQIYAGIRPHSINLNCMATPAGELYLSCSVCEQKYWAARVDANKSAVMRLDGVTFPVVLNRVEEPTRMDAAWNARITKLQSFGGGPYNPTPDPNAQRPDHWWTFHVTSRS